MNAKPAEFSLDIQALHEGYRDYRFSVFDVINEVHDRIERYRENPVWILVPPREQALARAREIDGMLRASAKPFRRFPLLGIPFALKDNMDVKGLPTTVACPEYAYVAEETAAVVRKLLDAGGVFIGKSNMDQFATGLVGCRSPYGRCGNAFNMDYIPGGSSSGSAVAVAAGLVSFALGTDTAGSGRVPAAFNNVVGLKPTHGRLSTTGVVPACPSLDCVAIFTLTCGDAGTVMRLAEGYDHDDIFSREVPAAEERAWKAGAFRFGVPRPDQLEFFGNTEYPVLFREAVARLKELGGREVVIDFKPFIETAKLMYHGPWVAERMAVYEDFLKAHPGSVHPDTLALINSADGFSAVDAFRAAYAVRQYKREIHPTMEVVDCIVAPTAGTLYTHREINDAPAACNTNLGYYTKFVNLLDLSAVAVPSGFQRNGLPFGISLIAQPFHERWLLELGAAFHARSGLSLGATRHPAPCGSRGLTDCVG